MRINTIEFDKEEILSNIEDINKKLVEERMKEKIDIKKERELIMQQFVQGLKLSTLQYQGKYKF